MPLALGFIGILLIIAGFRGTQGTLGTLVANDFSAGFLKWVAAIIAVGLLGFIPRAETPSRLLLALVILGLLFSNQGFFAQFSQQISNPATVNPPAQPVPTAPLSIELTAVQGAKPLTVQVTGAGSGGIVGQVTGAATKAAGAAAS